MLSFWSCPFGHVQNQSETHATEHVHDRNPLDSPRTGWLTKIGTVQKSIEAAMSTFLPRLLLVVLFSAFVSNGSVSLAEEQTADQRAVDAISHPEGLDLSLWANSEQLANPVAFTFDNQGRMFMCETFRQSKGVEDNRGHMDWLDDDLAAQSVEDRLAFFKKHLGDDVAKYTEEEDRITVIEDKDGDGKADEAWVFADGFNDILTGTGAGVLVHDNEVYYTCIPDVWKISDKNGDGTADSQTSLHRGYGVRVAFRGHDSHGLVIGPDGRIYFSIGDRGYNIKTEDGRHLKDPGSGAVFRCELDGSGLEVFATGLRNPQELTFDDAGNLFTGDNNSDSGDLARWVHVVEGGETGWNMAFQYLPDRGPWNREKLWHPRHEGQAAYIVPPIRNFADGPSGLTYYPGTGLGPQYRGTFFLCDFRGDAAISGIRSFKLQPNGATFEMSEPNRFLWNVLATDVEFGPDGGLYTSDWIQGWEGINRGRIVRVSHPKHSESKQVKFVASFLKKDLTETKPWQLANRLGHQDRRVRMKAQMELAKREAVGALVAQLGKEKNKYLHMHAVRTLGQIGRTTSKRPKLKKIVEALPTALQHKEPWVRAAAATAMGEMREDSFVAPLVAAMKDSDAAVRARAATALGRLKSQDSIDSLLALVSENDNRDLIIRHAGVMGLSGCASEDQLAELAKHEKQSVRLAGLLALRRLKSTKLTAFLTDADPFVVVEAARAIHDVPVMDAMSDLANATLEAKASDPLVRRVLNANYREGTEAAARKVASVLRMDVSETMKLEAIDMLRDWDKPSNRDRVLGMWRPIEARSGDFTKSIVKSLFDDGVIANAPPEVTVAAIGLASDLGLKQITGTIRKLIGDENADPGQRADLLSSLSKLDDPEFDSTVTKALSDASSTVRSRARDLLFDLDSDRGLAELTRGVASDTAFERQSALAKLAEVDSEATRTIIGQQVKQLVAGSVSADTQLDVVEAAKKVGLEDAIAPVMEKLKAKPYGERHLSEVGGDVARGEKIFQTNIELSCVRCHRVGRDGGRVGPNLAGIGKEKTTDYLLESIVDPNKKIADGFVTRIVVTDDGLQYQGVVMKEDADLIHMIDADGKRFFLAKEDIIADKVGKSAMPEDLVKKLTPFELRDLVAYLASLKTPYEESGHE